MAILRATFFIPTLIVVLIAGSTAALAQRDPVIGTWKLNGAKSKYDPGPAPKTSTLLIEPAGMGIRVTVRSVGADGRTTTTEYTASYDGQDYPVKITGTTPD